MRFNRLRSCIAVATILAGTASAFADNTDDDAAPDKVAQAQPDQVPPPASDQPGSSGPTTPAPAPVFTEDQMRKMIDEQIAKAKPKAGIPIEFTGYARAGVGLNVRGGKQVCFVLNGADAKWRLGNECDYVIEPQFTGRILNLPDGSSWGVVVMPGLYRTFEDPNGADRTFQSNVPAEFRQIYFFGENIPQLLNGRVWGGRRYYDRLHLDINDQFLEIHDSDGAGIEDMQLSFGKLSIAFLMNPNSEANPAATPMGAALSTANFAPFKINARLTDIKTMPEGSLQIWAGFQAASRSADKKLGEEDAVVPDPDALFRVGAYHTLGKVLGGTNFVGARVEFGSNHQQYRAVLQEQMQVNSGHTGIDVIGEFRADRNRANSDADWVTNNWVSLGARADHQIAGPFRFLVEAGLDDVLAATGGNPLLVKTTAALALSAGDSNGSRPTFRLFYTHGFWNDAAKTSPLGVFVGGTSGNRLQQVYGNASNGGSFGIQAEAWW
jgi:maltoporin